MSLDTDMAEQLVLLQEENKLLKEQLAKECQEHRGAMILAHTKIRELDKEYKAYRQALLNFAKYYWDDCGMEDCPVDEFYADCEDFIPKCRNCTDQFGSAENQDGICYVEYFLNKARKEQEDKDEN